MYCMQRPLGLLTAVSVVVVVVVVVTGAGDYPHGGVCLQVDWE